MENNAENLIWIDLEMTGLNPQTDLIIEIATIVTNKDLEILAEGPVIAIYVKDQILDHMDDWNTEHHGQSGLLKRVRQSQINLSQAQAQTLAFLSQYVPKGVSPMCGNSICQDRRFLFRLMPELEAYFHYRNLNVSAIKEFFNRWFPQLTDGFSKKSAHLALDDIRESIYELRHYRNSVTSHLK